MGVKVDHLIINNKHISCHFPVPLQKLRVESPGFCHFNSYKQEQRSNTSTGEYFQLYKIGVTPYKDPWVSLGGHEEHFVWN